MCHELIVANAAEWEAAPRATDLETLLARVGIIVLADTITVYWIPAERIAVLNWISAILAAGQCAEHVNIPPMPEVLVPFYEASLTIEA